MFQAFPSLLIKSEKYIPHISFDCRYRLRWVWISEKNNINSIELKIGCEVILDRNAGTYLSYSLINGKASMENYGSRNNNKELPQPPRKKSILTVSMLSRCEEKSFSSVFPRSFSLSGLFLRFSHSFIQ